MRALHVTPEYWPAVEYGGPVRADRLLISALHRAGVAVEVITTDMRGERSLPRVPTGVRSVDGVSVTTCSSAGSSSSGLSARLAFEVQRRVTSCDIVHLQGMWTFPVAAAAVACWRHHCPYVLTPRGCLHPWALGSKQLKKRAHLAIVGKRIVRRSAALHFTTEHERRAAHPLARDVAGFVVPNAVELEQLPPRDAVVAEEDKPPRVVILGRISAIKGFDRLVPAMALLRAAEPKVVLEVVGPNSEGYQQEVEALARRHQVHDIIEFVGLVDEDGRRRALQRASLLVAPSHGESFCMSVAEAMAAGVPVVVTEQVGLEDAVRRARAGIVVADQARDLADAMARLLADPKLRKDMGLRGRTLVADELSPEVVGGRMARAYHQVLQGTIAMS